MKTTDHIAQVLHQNGLRHFFAVTGGAAVHVIDSLIENAAIQATFHHHEQAAALAAEGYARLTGFGLCVVTTGPGVTNALTGLLCAWQDSTPCLFISGQARYENTSLGRNVRQVGTQHLEVLPVVSSMTKKAILLNASDNPIDVVNELISIAKSGRPGPVWLDIPLDVQLKNTKWLPSTSKNSVPSTTTGRLGAVKVQLISEKIRNAKRPIVLIGRGSASTPNRSLTDFFDKYHIPIIRTWGGLTVDIESARHDFGRIGVSGQRGANLIAGSADLMIVLGARLGQAVVGPAVEWLAQEGELIVVDIDHNELEILNARREITAINSTVEEFLNLMNSMSNEIAETPHEWLEYCMKVSEWNHEQFQTSADTSGINQYELVRHINSLNHRISCVVIDGGGTIVYTAMQALSSRKGMEIIIPSSSAPMGTGLPHAIGASRALNNEPIIVLCGDGSFPFNVQELETIKHHNLNINILIVNNGGYLSIQETQNQFLESRHHGSSLSGELSLPEIQSIATAYAVKYLHCIKRDLLESTLFEAIKYSGPCVVEIVIQPGQQIFPRQGFAEQSDGTFKARPLTDMDPHVETPISGR